MKWTIAGAGVLLSVAGAYAVINGSSIIQVERGWATFIAGSVLLGSGVIVLAIAALMGRIDYLTEIYIASVENAEDPADHTQEAVDKREFVPQRHVPEPQSSNERVAPQPPLREARAYQQVFAPAPTPEPEPVHEPIASEPVEPAPEAAADRPRALRDFKFVFPSADVAPAPEPEPEPAPPLARPAPLELVKPAAASSLTWLRRNRQPAPELATPEPEPESVTEPAPEPVEESLAEEPQSATLAGENFDDQGFAPEPEASPAPELAPQEVVVAESRTQPVREPAPDPFSTDWLERALAGDDEPRVTPSSLRRPPVDDEAPKAQEPEPTPDEPVSELVAEDESAEPAPPKAPESEPEPIAEGPRPVEIGRYRANDVAYVMFSDGSITAETPAGASYRFASLIELRAFIERGGA